MDHSKIIDTFDTYQGLVSFISGNRSQVSPGETAATIVKQVPGAENNFMVHRHWPSDFLFVFGSRRKRDEVMAAGAVDGKGFALHFTPWNRQLQATRCSLRFRVVLELTGILAHA